jgi:serine/threonine protein kinase
MKFPCARAAVLPFAKRGDDRSNNLVRLQQLFPRIVAADYEQPKRVTDDCRALLKRMLTPDPAKRITIPEIMRHPWCAATHEECMQWHVLLKCMLVPPTPLTATPSPRPCATPAGVPLPACTRTLSVRG